MLALLESIAYTLFPLLAKLVVLLGQVLLRIFVLSLPIAGLIGIFNNQFLRQFFNAIAGVTLHVVVIAALSGMYTFIVNLVFKAEDRLSTFAMLTIMAICAMIFIGVGKPIRRIIGMLTIGVFFVRRTAEDAIAESAASQVDVEIPDDDEMDPADQTRQSRKANRTPPRRPGNTS